MAVFILGALLWRGGIAAHAAASSRHPEPFQWHRLLTHRVLTLFHSVKENVMCGVETGLKLGLPAQNPQSLRAQEEESVSSGRKYRVSPSKNGGAAGMHRGLQGSVGAFSISAPATPRQGGGLGVEGRWGWVAVKGPGLEAGGGLALGWVRERRLRGGFWLG